MLSTVLSLKRVSSPRTSHAYEASLNEHGVFGFELKRPTFIVVKTFLDWAEATSSLGVRASRMPYAWQLHGSDPS